MTLNIYQDIRLELINENHSQPIFELVDKNRTHLRAWLPFVDRIVAFAENFVKGTMRRNIDGNEFAFAIVETEVLHFKTRPNP
jgi:ribosomal-protein-serine acetyltransferase